MILSSSTRGPMSFSDMLHIRSKPSTLVSALSCRNPARAHISSGLVLLERRSNWDWHIESQPAKTLQKPSQTRLLSQTNVRFCLIFPFTSFCFVVVSFILSHRVSGEMQLGLAAPVQEALKSCSQLWFKTWIETKWRCNKMKPVVF